MDIALCIMWWTIDSYFDSKSDTVVPLKKTCLVWYLDTVKLASTTTITYLPICMKDSRQLSLKDLEKLLETIQNTDYEYYLVTHWTYTMPDTARYLEQKLWKKITKRVILTWSMIPITWFCPSDAWFNLWYATAKLESVKPGVYVAMNWRIFLPHESAKLISEWRFTSFFS